MPHFGNVPHPRALLIVKHEAKFIMNQTYKNYKVYEWEGYYAYSNSGREFDGYKVPSKWTTYFIWMFYGLKTPCKEQIVYNQFLAFGK